MIPLELYKELVYKENCLIRTSFSFHYNDEQDLNFCFPYESFAALFSRVACKRTCSSHSASLVIYSHKTLLPTGRPPTNYSVHGLKSYSTQTFLFFQLKGWAIHLYVSNAVQHVESILAFITFRKSKLGISGVHQKLKLNLQPLSAAIMTRNPYEKRRTCDYGAKISISKEMSFIGF